MGIDEAMQRHPAGKLKRQAEKSPHSLGWALGMAKKLGEVEGKKSEQSRIIKLLLETPEGLDAMLAWVDHDDQGEAIIALIKGDQE